MNHTDTPIDIHSRRELFVDDTLIERLGGGAGHRMHPPVRREVVFEADGPHDDSISGYYSVHVDPEGRYRLYYRGRHTGGDEKHDQTANLAMSSDGIHFERPELGLYDLGDGGKNNVVWRGVHGHNLIPFLDRNPDAAPEARFKAVGGTGKNNLYALHSPDGIAWRLAREEPLEVPGNFDSANVAFWDAEIGKYRLFSRYAEKPRGRSIQSCTSEDFLHWTDPVPHQYDDDAPLEQFYTNATMPVPGAEHILLSFPMRYVASRTTPVADTSAMMYPGNDTPGMTGMTDAVIMSSRDGVHWKRPFLEAWLRAGLDERNWTHRNTLPGVGILPLHEDEWSMYVSEHYGWPDNRLRRVTVRPWGFASIHAGYRGGEVVTRPLTFTGGKLRLNFSTSAVGSVRVEIQDADGTPIEGCTLDDMDPVYGDALDQVFAWQHQANLSHLVGQPVRLRFALKDADVYAMRFTDQ